MKWIHETAGRDLGARGIDARTVDRLASAEVPRAIPLGFHGSFLRHADRSAGGKA